MKSAIESAHHDTVTRFQREIKQLKSINQDLQQKYQAKQQDYKDKVCFTFVQSLSLQTVGQRHSAWHKFCGAATEINLCRHANGDCYQL